MLRRRLKSALFIDFENVQLDPEGMANALAWIEDGAFEEDGRGRKLLAKTIYWNSTSERNRARYEALGFDVVLCEKYANLKNGADIRIAMDMVEARMRRPNIEEFILISKDSDFVPVLQRLRERKRRTTVVVDESKPAIYTVYAKTADTTFPLRRLMGEGRTYSRPQEGLLARVGFGVGWFTRAAVRSSVAAVTQPTPVMALRSSSVAQSAADTSEFSLAVEAVVAAAARNGGQSTGRQSITKELKSVPGFSSNGTTRYFGYGSYEALIKAIAAQDSRVDVRGEKGGGMSLVFVGMPQPGAASQTVAVATASHLTARA
jgi:NYN domain